MYRYYAGSPCNLSEEDLQIEGLEPRPISQVGACCIVLETLKMNNVCIIWWTALKWLEVSSSLHMNFIYEKININRNT